MTTQVQALHDAIFADATAKALADAGNDSGAALRMQSVLPPALVSTYINERAIYAAFSNPMDAAQVMGALAAIAAGNTTANPPVPANPIVAAALRWLEPNNGGIDVSNPNVSGMLDSMATAGAITTAQAGTIKALAQQPAQVSAADVSRSWAQYRPDGKVVS